MFRHPLPLVHLGPVLIALALLLSLGQMPGSATAQTDTPAVWEEGQLIIADSTQADIAIPAVATTPGTYYRTYPGIRFVPTISTLTYAPSAGGIHATALPCCGYSFSLNFDLPPGATITEVVFYVVDNSTFDMTLQLRSYNPETNNFVALETADSSGASLTLQTIVIPVDPAVQVDLATTSYLLRVVPAEASNAHLLRGARIGYTLSQVFLPLLTK